MVIWDYWTYLSCNANRALLNPGLEDVYIDSYYPFLSMNRLSNIGSALLVDWCAGMYHLTWLRADNIWWHWHHFQCQHSMYRVKFTSDVVGWEHHVFKIHVWLVCTLWSLKQDHSYAEWILHCTCPLAPIWAEPCFRYNLYGMCRTKGPDNIIYPMLKYG